MAATLEVADIFRRHGEAFRHAHVGHLGRDERRVMGAITACRTAALGGHVEQCDDCGMSRIAYNSCRNRHCPKCQGSARVQWLAERQAELPMVHDGQHGAILFIANWERKMLLAGRDRIILHRDDVAIDRSKNMVGATVVAVNP